MQQLLLHLSLLPLLTALGTGLIRFRGLSTALRLLVVATGVTALTELVARVLWAYQQPNLFLLPFCTTLEFGLLAGAYSLTADTLAARRGIRLLGLTFVVASALAYRSLELSAFNSGQRFAESLLVLALALQYFLQVQRTRAAATPQAAPMLWVSIGLFVYFSGSSLLFLSSQALLQYSRQLNLNAWALHAALFSLLYCTYALVFWQRPEN